MNVEKPRPDSELTLSVSLNGTIYNNFTTYRDTGITVTPGQQLWPSITWSGDFTKLEVAVFDGGGHEIPMIDQYGDSRTYVVDSINGATNPYVPCFVFPEGTENGTYWLTAIIENSTVHHETKIAVSYGAFEPIWPAASTYQISCLYYYKDSSQHSTKYGYQTAIDISGSGNVLATESGTVTTVADLGNSSFGKYIIITHGNGKKSLYGHLSSQAVSEGQTVNRGQVIGVIGSTGNSSGPHLHFELSGSNPMKDYFYSRYRKKMSFEQNVYSNNDSYNSDKWICNCISDEFYKSGTYYYYGSSSSGSSSDGAAYSYSDYTNVSLNDIKEFLALFPKSVLNNSNELHNTYAAQYGTPGSTSMKDAFKGYTLTQVSAMDPAEIIYRSCVSQNCNVVYLLATLQKEQGLFNENPIAGKAHALKWATGYGVYSTDDFTGFIQQVYWCAHQQNYFQSKGYTTEVAYGKYSPESDGNRPFSYFYETYYLPFANMMDNIMK